MAGEAQVPYAGGRDDEISSATREESSAITQVNVVVSELDRMTQQNATFVEQGVAAAASLTEQAHKLAQVVAAFRLREDAAASPPLVVPVQLEARRAPRYPAPVRRR